MMAGTAPSANARRSDPGTSHAAAAAISPRLTRIERQVLREARRWASQGFTDLDLETALGDHGSTFRTRRRELVDRGYIRDTGRTVRPAGRARKFIIWAVTRKGQTVDLGRE